MSGLSLPRVRLGVLGVTLFDAVGVVGFDDGRGVGGPAWRVPGGAGGRGGAAGRHAGG